MHNPDNLNLSKFSQNVDYDSFLEEDDILDFEFDRELYLLKGKTNLDETDDYFRDEH